MKFHPCLPVTYGQVAIIPNSTRNRKNLALFYIFSSKQTMSASCGRNPPPFPDNDDQEAELDNRVLDSDEDDDEGEDIFTGASVRQLFGNK